MTDVLDLIRPDLKGFGGYSSAATESASTPAIKIDANESPWPPFGTIGEMCNAHRYAEPQPLALRQRMGELWGAKTDEILLTSGSGQGIDLLIRLFCQAGVDEILICPPTFPLYQVCARVQGATTVSVPLRPNGQLDLETINAKATDNTKLIFIPTPSAPMGHAIAKTDILTLCKMRDGKSIIVADEAYVEYASDPAGLTASLNAVPNLVILRTMSKAHALAGERVGCVMAPAPLIAALRSIAPPYPLAQSSVRTAMDALSPSGLAQSQARRQTIIAERTRLIDHLPQSKEVVRVYPSQANFIFLETTGSDAFLERLRRFGIAARNMKAQRQNCVRLSVGSPNENDMVLKALDIETSSRSQSTRLSSLRRRTKETSIDVTVDLDNPSIVSISTGLGFFDHMLDQLATHGGFGLVLQAKGDLNVDTHHTIEDCALALGETLRKALGDKKGIARFGFTAPLDEAVASVVIDLSGRPFIDFRASWPQPCGDGMSPDLVEHFFRSFATNLGATLHITLRGENCHHMIEATFKAVGRALRQAFTREGTALPSTKGVL